MFSGIHFPKTFLCEARRPTTLLSKNLFFDSQVVFLFVEKLRELFQNVCNLYILRTDFLAFLALNAG